MASTWSTAVKSTPGRRFVLIYPVLGLEVKGVSPGSLEVGVGSREQEPTRTTDRTAITARLGHDLNAGRRDPKPV